MHSNSTWIQHKTEHPKKCHFKNGHIAKLQRAKSARNVRLGAESHRKWGAPPKLAHTRSNHCVQVAWLCLFLVLMKAPKADKPLAKNFYSHLLGSRTALLRTYSCFKHFYLLSLSLFLATYTRALSVPPPVIHHRRCIFLLCPS